MTARPRIPTLAADAAWQTLCRGLAAAGRDHTVIPCQGEPELWFADDPGDRFYAATECAPCPLLAACGGYARAAREHHGVWAGQDRTALSVRQRTARAAKTEAAAEADMGGAV